MSVFQSIIVYHRYKTGATDFGEKAIKRQIQKIVKKWDPSPENGEGSHILCSIAYSVQTLLRVMSERVAAPHMVMVERSSAVILSM